MNIHLTVSIMVIFMKELNVILKKLQCVIIEKSLLREYNIEE
jgi:hypothetical protein